MGMTIQLMSASLRSSWLREGAGPGGQGGHFYPRFGSGKSFPRYYIAMYYIGRKESRTWAADRDPVN